MTKEVEGEEETERQREKERKVEGEGKERGGTKVWVNAQNKVWANAQKLTPQEEYHELSGAQCSVILL